MRIACPNCAAKYEVDAALFPDEGREVQCSNCEDTWVQYPVAEEQPMRLDALAAVDEPGPATLPSERLSTDERAALAEAVREEIDVNAGGFAETAPVDDDFSDAEIISSLRKQIKVEGGDFKGGDGAMSQRRNLRKAAEAAGVSVDEAAEEQPKSRWSFARDDDDSVPQSSRSGLAAALREYEAERVPESRRSGKRAGFVTALVLLGIGTGVYVMRDDVVAAYPPAEPYVAQYVGAVDAARVQVEALYAEYGVMVVSQITELTSGGGEAAAE